MNNFLFGVFQLVSKRIDFVQFLYHEFNQILYSTKSLEKQKFVPDIFENQINKDQIQQKEQIQAQILQLQLINQVSLPFHNFLNLQSLSLINCTITQECFHSICYCSKISSFQSINCENINDFSILLQCKNLKNVFISSLDQTITFIEVEHVDNCIVIINQIVKLMKTKFPVTELLSQCDTFKLGKKLLQKDNQSFKQNTMEKHKSYFDLLWNEQKMVNCSKNPLHSDLQIVDKIGTLISETESHSFHITKDEHDELIMPTQSNKQEVINLLKQIVENQQKILTIQSTNQEKLDYIQSQIKCIKCKIK
ncbi:hypothetical protein SS50377_23650 [Spironucleus salmonicida]|uniref:Uncharacterized protein n=1 Tax=Spironucleus salmonicida TaxID=348837 RepID=A0A9P8LST5_9EUKA|nr:hypothetical protein SS50377_23650 [Spironucleus salmonicida]